MALWVYGRVKDKNRLDMTYDKQFYISSNMCIQGLREYVKSSEVSRQNTK